MTTVSLTSPAFGQNDEMPSRHTCDGENLSPPLAWSGAPEGTASFALIVDDPDAPDPKAPSMTWVHWVVCDLPPDCMALAEGMNAARLPKGAREGMNDWQRTGYGGPCPPLGRHRYFHKLYALDVRLPALHRPTKPELERAMRGHILAEAQLIGMYARRAR